MYRDGVFFPQDLQRALFYFEKAQNDSEHAATLAKEVRQVLAEQRS